MFLLSFLLHGLLSPMAMASAWPDLSKPVRSKTRSSAKDAALIVSVEDYAFVPDVPGAQRSGLDWYTWFTRSQKLSISRVSLLENTKASRETILDEARRLAKEVGKGGRLWFVFIGHGAPSKDGKDGLMLGVDVQQTASSVYARGVSQTELLRILEASGAPVTAVIDACFSGKNSTGQAIAKGLQPLIVAKRRTQRSSTVLTAGKGDEFAGDLPGLGRPAFSYLALGALRGWGDANKDGQVSGQELINYSRDAIRGLVQERSQTPQGFGQGLGQALSRAAEAGPDLVSMRVGLSGAAASTTPAAVNSQVSVQGGEGQDFAALARQVRRQEAAEKAEEERIRKAKEAIAAAERAKQERLRQAKMALEKAAQKKLAAAEQKLQAKATRDWGAIKGMLKGGGKSVQGLVKKYVSQYDSVKLTIEGFSRIAKVPEVTLAKKWLGEQGSGPVSKGDGYEAVLIPAGTFTMGCTSEQGSDCYGSEKPSHSVRISRSFYMMKSEVTQGLYKKVMGKNPSHFSSCGSNCPVEKVSWYDAVSFANKLSKKEGRTPCYSISGTNVRFQGLSCTGWRLPTEAEWEYAARGGQSTKYAGSSEVSSVAWYDKNSGSKTHAVCGKKKNGYGLCDMSGNVWEWVWDWFGSYSSSSQADPLGPSSGTSRVLRGGSWYNRARYVRVSIRNDARPSVRDFSVGFRVLRTFP